MNGQPRVRLGNLLMLMLIVVGTIWAVWQRQTLLDFWRLQSFKPSAEIARLAETTTMRGRGKDLFYSSQPALLTKETFNQHCTNNNEQSIVLGCYREQTIYLYDVTDSRLAGVEEVTAAHEMLHASYERLSDQDKKHVDSLLEPQIKSLTDSRLLGLIDLYNKQEPGELYNEMHSILGTELRDLSPELENYYKQYFTDRKKIVDYSERYETLFSNSKARIETFDKQLTDLKEQIDANNARLEAEQRELETQANTMTTLRNSSQIDAYNAQVPLYNAKVQAFNALVATTKSHVEEYNRLVEERNQEVAAQDDLYQSLNSRYQPKE